VSELVQILFRNATKARTIRAPPTETPTATAMVTVLEEDDDDPPFPEIALDDDGRSVGLVVGGNELTALWVNPLLERPELVADTDDRPAAPN